MIHQYKISSRISFDELMGLLVAFFSLISSSATRAIQNAFSVDRYSTASRNFVTSPSRSLYFDTRIPFYLYGLKALATYRSKSRGYRLVRVKDSRRAVLEYDRGLFRAILAT
jgi:hypothetical protein